jgi:hypothetical protein
MFRIYFFLIFAFSLSVISAQQTANIDDMPYKFKVYPIPTTNEVNIELEYYASFWRILHDDGIHQGTWGNTNFSNVTIKVYNIIGEVVRQQPTTIAFFDTGIFHQKQIIYLNGLPSGLYIISIQKDDQSGLPPLYVSKTLLVH